MTPHQRDFLLTQICAGEVVLKYAGKSYFYRYPNQSQRYRANVIYQEIVDNNDGLLSQEEMIEYLIEDGKWNKRFQEEIDVHIPKVMDDLKVDIYLATINDNRYLPSLNEKLSKVKARLLELLNIKHKYDEYTLESLAEKQKLLYLFKKNIKKLDTAPENLLQSYYESSLSESTSRELSRCGEWLLKWTGIKKGLKVFFGNSTEDQERLVRWTCLYEGILEGQEIPPDAVIDNDDAFDGYLITRRKENDRLRGIEEMEKKLGDKAKGSCEVFLPANNIEEAQRNNLLNTPDAIKVKENRFAQIERMGVVKQGQLQDERIKIEMAINRMNT